MNKMVVLSFVMFWLSLSDWFLVCSFDFNKINLIQTMFPTKLMSVTNVLFISG